MDTLSKRKQTILEASERYSKEYSNWLPKKAYFQNEDLRYLKFLIPEGLRILDVGCGLGDKLSALKPCYGVGLDFSPKLIHQAQQRHADPNLRFLVADVEKSDLEDLHNETFDIILLSDVIGLFEDCQHTLETLKQFCTHETRIIVSYYSRLWDPVLKIAEQFNQKFPQPENNYLSTLDISNLLCLAKFKPIKREWRQLVPKHWYGLGPLINRTIGTLPGIRRLCLRNYIVARPVLQPAASKPSVSVIIPCRNEEGNIEPAITRLPKLCDDVEIIFIEGHSQDGTLQEIKRVIQAYPQHNIKLLVQDKKGKGDAVRKAFDHASKDILMILDADLTTPPEDMPKFYEAIASGTGEFINGSRLVYPMENQAMRFLNFLANKTFSWIFSYLLNQRFTDTLCGTKVLYRKDYLKIAHNRNYFGDFDPFGDFDLIFGASKLNLEVIEIPVRYAARTYGSTQISRFQHGWLLLRMVVFAFRKLKAF